MSEADSKQPKTVDPAKSDATPTRPTVMQWVFLAAVAGLTTVLDLWSKSWAMRRLSTPYPRPVPVCTPPSWSTHEYPQHYPTHTIAIVQNYLELHYAENCGGAFGLLRSASESLRKPFFMLITIGAIAFIVHLYRTLEPGQRAMRVALPLVLAGAIGNLVDRMRLGYVVDFIDAHWGARHWPTFNVADIAITVGIGLMVLEWIVGPKRAPVKSKKANPAAT